MQTSFILGLLQLRDHDIERVRIAIVQTSTPALTYLLTLLDIITIRPNLSAI